MQAQIAQRAGGLGGKLFDGWPVGLAPGWPPHFHDAHPLAAPFKRQPPHGSGWRRRLDHAAAGRRLDRRGVLKIGRRLPAGFGPQQSKLLAGMVRLINQGGGGSNELFGVAREGAGQSPAVRCAGQLQRGVAPGLSLSDCGG